MRKLWVLAHRYVGLVLALFLTIAGATGAVLAFYEELDTALAPELFSSSPPTPDAQPLDPFVLRARVAAQYPDAQINWVDVHREPGRSVVFYLEPKPDAAPPQNEEVFVNPYTGGVQGERSWGDLSQGVKNLMPFIYQVHYSLALGAVGTTLFGVIALLWTLDCFVGAYLTFPPARRPAHQDPNAKTWCARWRSAWALRLGVGFYKFNFDLHRAGGLWLWAILFVFAWSSVAFNLSDVYRPVMRAAFGYEAPRDTLPRLADPLEAPPIGFAQAHEMMKAEMARRAAAEQFTIRRERLIHYNPNGGYYGYRVLSSRDVGDSLGNTTLYMDARSGAFVGFEAPTGRVLGNTITTWLMALHVANVGGLAYRLFVCALGLAVVALSVTGVVIWLRKRRSRAYRAQGATTAVDPLWAVRRTVRTAALGVADIGSKLSSLLRRKAKAAGP